MRPKVSVVTCTYNRPDFLRRAVESLRNQTDSDWEHLIYDNGSTDPRVAEVLAWAREDRRVRTWRGESNRDQPAVFWNFLLDRALGRYFTVLDDDNTKLERFVEVMSRELDADLEIGVVTCGFVVVNPDGSRAYEHVTNLQTSSDTLAERSMADGGALLYRREVFERAGYFSEELRTNEDWDWLRRAVAISRVKNLDERLTTYQNHDSNRMWRSAELGSDSDVVKLKSRVPSDALGVRLIRPDPSRMTQSQEDVIRGLSGALGSIPWVREGEDLAVLVAPFQLRDEEIRAEAAGCRQILSLHMEDPYALGPNLDRVQVMREVAPTWVATNDASAVSAYQELVGGRVTTYPSLSADSTIGVPIAARRDIDVLLCGYAYPSRKRFVAELLPALREIDLRVVLVGDGWAGSGFGVECHSTMSAEESYWMHARARAVVCAHRVNGDCADGPAPPQTVNRGYLEGYCGARVFLDRSRGHHHLDDWDVVWYNGSSELAAKLAAHLRGPDLGDADAFADKCRALYTYRARLAKILNCVRGARHLAEVP